MLVIIARNEANTIKHIHPLPVRLALKYYSTDTHVNCQYIILTTALYTICAARARMTGQQ